jgi:ornithine decarboxylase
MVVIAEQAPPKLPTFWPTALRPETLAGLDLPTPFLACDLDEIRERYRRFAAELPGVRCCYAVKANASPEVLRTLADAGSGFEIASHGELRLLTDLGVDPSGLLYSNPIKPAAHIAEAFRDGVWRFGFDTEGELHKLARHAPGSSVYLRLAVANAGSTFPLSHKFGVDRYRGRQLLRLAASLGLRPYGVTFHVGSQCGGAGAWRAALTSVGRLLAGLREDGIELAMLDIGGGFPARYAEDDGPSPAEIGQVLFPALDELLPYRPALIAAEPGRFLVAEAGVLVATVLGRAARGSGKEWLHLDVGAYNGLMESLQAQGRWHFPFWTSRADHASVPHVPFTLAGPSCDSCDTMFADVLLPATIDVDDRLYIGTAGAYTLSYASGFNGFLPPEPVYVGGHAH